jgi:hypothetical protein
MNLLFNAPVVGGAEWQTGAQLQRTTRNARTELAQTDPMAIEMGDDLSARMRFEGDVRSKPDGKSCWPGPSRSLYSRTAQMTLRSAGVAD